MSHYVVLAYDAPGSAEPRLARRDAHFAHVERIVDSIAVAGPLKDDAGSAIGSLFVLKCDSAADAEAVLKSDPYFAAGVWERWDVHPFVAAAGEWVGGKIW